MWHHTLVCVPLCIFCDQNRKFHTWWICLGYIVWEFRHPVTDCTTIVLLLNVSFYCSSWGRDEIDATSQTTFSNAFSWMKIHSFLLRFHWNVYTRVQLTTFQPDRHQAIIWINDDNFTDAYMRHYVSVLGPALRKLDWTCYHRNLMYKVYMYSQHGAKLYLPTSTSLFVLVRFVVNLS